MFYGAVEQLTGYTIDQMLTGKPRWDRLIIPEDRKRVRQAGMRLISQPGRSDNIEYRIRRKDGQIRWVNDIAHSVVGSVGKITNIQGTIYDITERKLAEQSLQESEERFRSLYENATIGMYRTTPEGKILMANPALVRTLGFETFEELAARDLEQDGFQPDYPRQEFKRRVEEEGEVIGFEAAWSRKDGNKIHVRESAKAIRDQQGKTLYYEGTVEDIAERKRAELALRASEASHRSLFENIPEGIYRTTPDGKLLTANPPWCACWVSTQRKSCWPAI
jgi:PAS domain S-box-containing protein